MRALKTPKSLFAILAVCAISSLLTSCFEDGGTSVTFGNGAATGGNGVSITITKIQNVTAGSWVTDGSGKVYLQSGSVNIQGDCTRGVAVITAKVNASAVAETATCKVDGTFSWDKVFNSVTPALGTSYDILFEGANTDLTVISGVSAAKTIVIDTTAPTAPTLNAVAGCTLTSGTWICNSASVVVSGSWSAVEDVLSLQTPSPGTVSYPTATTFNFNLTLTEGQSRTLSFTVKDRAGNTSGVSTLSVSYSPTVSALASSVNAGGTVGFAGGPINTAASMIGNVGTMSVRSYDLNSALPVSQRVQLQTGPIAIGAQQINP